MEQEEMMLQKRDTIVVWFSCGAASAVAAALTKRIYGGRCDIRIVNNPVKQEDEDNRRFLRDIERWLDHPIEMAVNKKYPTGDCQQVWSDRKYMSGPNGAPCTHYLKKQARQQWEAENPFEHMVLGFHAGEEARHQRFIRTERNNVLPVLIWEGLTKSDCIKILVDHGIKLPRIYELGYPNANCIGCVKATSPTYWNHVRKIHPDIFAERAIQSREIGCRLVRYKGNRIYLDELPETAKGRPMKTLPSIECGIYCEERP